MALELQCQVHCQLLSTGQTYCKGIVHDKVGMLQLIMHSIRVPRKFSLISVGVAYNSLV